MSSSINIYPFTDTEGLIRFGIQIAIFLVGLFVAHKLIIKPALRLNAERKKRTVGNNDAAKKDIERANLLEHEYFTRLKEGADAVHKMYAEEISAAQKLALTIVSESQTKSNEHIKNVREQLLNEKLDAKTKLLPMLDDIVDSIYKRLGILSTTLVLLASFYFMTPRAYSLEETLIPSFWYSVFWPYFQFVIFIVAIVYFARAPITSLLEKRRDDLRAKLSEAHEAVYLAGKKVKEYEEKVALLETELKALKERNMEEARFERERIIKEANKTSTIILKDAQRTATELIHSSQEEIKKELFLLAINEVEKRLTEGKLAILDQKLKHEVIENIKNIH